MSSADYFLYMLRCKDGRLYTGIAIDVERRVAEHSAGPRGARSLRGKGPFSVVLRHAAGDRAAASKLEARIKKLSKADKEALVAGRLPMPAGD